MCQLTQREPGGFQLKLKKPKVRRPLHNDGIVPQLCPGTELAALEGELYDKAAAAAGKEIVDHNIQTWRAMIEVLETGEHCPHHLRGRKLRS